MDDERLQRRLELCVIATVIGGIMFVAILWLLPTILGVFLCLISWTVAYIAGRTASKVPFDLTTIRAGLADRPADPTVVADDREISPLARKLVDSLQEFHDRLEAGESIEMTTVSVCECNPGHLRHAGTDCWRCGGEGWRRETNVLPGLPLKD